MSGGGQRPSPADDPAALRTVAVTVAREAAAWLRRERPAGRVGETGTKSSPTDPITAYDTSVQELVRAHLQALRPGDAFLGEEGAPDPEPDPGSGSGDGPGDGPSGGSGVRWVVDPIDGTVNFMYGLPAYAVSVAAERDGVSVAGCVVDVGSGEEFSAARGHGATLQGGRTGRRDDEAGPVRLRVPDAPPLAQALVATGFSYDVDTRRRQAAAVACLLTEVRDVRRLGAASLDLCAVAAGRVDAYVEQGLLPWDLAAGGLIAEEAGAVVVGPGGQAPGERLVLATLPELLAPLRDLVERCGF